ncbi:hypothetical protein IFM89_025711 [Coptis chinensis]|uniref:Uncharacterized protein n=1 Tax=Coptis chinensis TaxID=261450 RepID=A0A835I5A3_9MAGN|nr:hypothetical protein IFM89_025711 [Coptis chinensis]
MGRTFDGMLQTCTSKHEVGNPISRDGLIWIGDTPGLSRAPSENGGGLCGLHAATKIMRRMTSAPKAIPRIAALDIEAAKTTLEENNEITKN